MLASTSEASARPARPKGGSLAEGAAAAAAGAATDRVVCGFGLVLADGAVRFDFAFEERFEREPCAPARATGSSRSAGVVLGSVLVGSADDLATLVAPPVVDEPVDAGAGWGSGADLTLDPELAPEWYGSGAGAVRVDGYGSGLGEPCPYAGAATSAANVDARATVCRRRQRSTPPRFTMAGRARIPAAADSPWSWLPRAPRSSLRHSMCSSSLRSARKLLPVVEPVKPGA